MILFGLAFFVRSILRDCEGLFPPTRVYITTYYRIVLCIYPRFNWINFFVNVAVSTDILQGQIFPLVELMSPSRFNLYVQSQKVKVFRFWAGNFPQVWTWPGSTFSLLRLSNAQADRCTFPLFENINKNKQRCLLKHMHSLKHFLSNKKQFSIINKINSLQI